MKTTLLGRQTLAALAVFLIGFSASAQVYINEVLADNSTAYQTADGDFPDFVELINTNATTSANISNWRLSIDVSQPNDYRKTYIFPANSVIPPRGFLVVICDGNTNQRYHTKFNIGKNGETLTLLGAQLGLRDSVRFGFQAQDFSMGRVPDGPPGVHALCRPTPGDFNVQAALGARAKLRFNEWAPSRGSEDDWFELFNSDTKPVSLGGLIFSDRSTNNVVRTNSWIGAGEFIQFRCDNNPDAGADHVNFKLTSQGMDANPPEWLILYAANGSSIIHQAFWTNAVLGESYGWLPDGNTNDPVVTFPVGKDTPGKSNFLPIDNVYINEIMSHTDLPFEDAVELYNWTGTNVDISGWWLSDDKDVYNKFRIPPNTIIPPNGYKTFYEYAGIPGMGFNPNGAGIFPSFSFSSSQGDQCYLYSTYPGTTRLNGYRRGVDFPASENGVSFGRYVTSTGESDFVPMVEQTFGSDVKRTDPPERISDFRAGLGATNSVPKFGPLVISEIMYHPPDFFQNNTNVKNEIDEYIEIYNMSTVRVKLWDTNVYTYYDYPYTNTFHLRGDGDFNFPTNVILEPGESLVVVNFPLTNNPPIQLNLFRSKFHVPPNVRIFGPLGGHLSDGGSTIQIERPDAPQDPAIHPDEANFVPYLRVDKARFDDDPPWPPEPDGYAIDPLDPNSVGYALVRTKPEDYGGDVASWRADYPSPGYQRIQQSVSIVGNQFIMSFLGLAGSSYTIQYKDHFEDTTWSTLQVIPRQTASGTRQVVTTVDPGTMRFYRVSTP